MEKKKESKTWIFLGKFLLHEFLSSLSMPPPEDESGNGGGKVGGRVLMKEVFIGWNGRGYF